MPNPEIQVKQQAIAERLQLKWLERMEVMLDEGTISATDMATLRKFLADNGWTVDPSRLPQGLRDKLTQNIDPEDFDDDEQVLPMRAAR